MGTFRGSPLFLAGLTSIVCLAIGGPAPAQEVAKARKGDRDLNAAQQKSGELRQPTPDEARQLSDAMKKLVDQSQEGLTVERRRDGTKMVDLQDRFHSMSIAKVSGGTVSTRCVTSAAEVDEFLRSDAVAAKGKVRKSGKKAPRTGGKE